jgi:hypothetical protein
MQRQIFESVETQNLIMKQKWNKSGTEVEQKCKYIIILCATSEFLYITI